MGERGKIQKSKERTAERKRVIGYIRSVLRKLTQAIKIEKTKKKKTKNLKYQEHQHRSRRARPHRTLSDETQKEEVEATGEKSRKPLTAGSKRKSGVSVH